MTERKPQKILMIDVGKLATQEENSCIRRCSWYGEQSYSSRFDSLTIIKFASIAQLAVQLTCNEKVGFGFESPSRLFLN